MNAIFGTVSPEAYNSAMMLGYGLTALGAFLVAGGAAVRAVFHILVSRYGEPVETLSVNGGSLIGDREYQQDYFLHPKSDDPGLLQSGVLAVVCDGMGGMEGGEKASRLCAELVYNGFYQVGGTENICQLLWELVTAADREIAQLRGNDGRPLNSGTTVVAAAVKDDKAYWVSVGDSRIYLFHDGRLEQLTRDQNFRLTLQERCSAGLITPQQMEADCRKDALISYVGKGGDITIDTGVVSFRPAEDDLLLLCSDGLYKSVTEGEIQRMIQRHIKQPQKLTGILTRAAISGGTPGKHDNITVLTISK